MESRAICILGMHRSGTSTITRALNFLGAYLGEEEDLIPPAPDNPEGFWERGDVVSLHDRILEKFRRSPDTVTPLPLKWQELHYVQHLKEELRALIQQNFSQQKLWAWKDPRTCLMLELWKQLLAERSIPLSCVFIVRNPIDVAKSLKKRNDMPFDKALGFWLNHNLCALESAACLPTVFVSYDHFLEDWEPNLRRVAKLLDLTWPEHDSDVKDEIASFIQPGLRHNQSRAEELESVPAPVRDLYHLILAQTTLETRERTFDDAVARLSTEFRSYSRFFDADMNYLYDRGRRLAEIDRRDLEIAGKTEVFSDTNAAGTSAKAGASRLATGAKRFYSLVFGK